jgi:hypothetical protein
MTATAAAHLLLVQPGLLHMVRGVGCGRRLPR